MKRTLVVVVALAGALGFGLWMWKGVSQSRAPAQRAEPAAVVVEDRVPSPPVVEPAATVVDEPEPEAASAPATVPEGERMPLAEAAGARWVEGTVLFPPGTPADEEAYVVARVQSKSLPDPSTRVGPDGRFRLAVGGKPRSVRLDLVARYLRLEDRVTCKLGDAAKPVTLAPSLGGRIEGRLVVPAGARPPPGGFVLVSAEDSFETLARGTEVAELAFHLDALDPELDHHLSYEGSSWVGEVVGLRVEPGRTREVELALLPGVVLAGHVRDEAGRPLAHVLVMGHRDRDPRSGRSTESDAGGAFRLEALAPGAIAVEARLESTVSTRLELGALEAGTQREDLELVIDRGESAAGRVLWPDGTPAEAWVTAEPDAARDEPAETKRTDSEGRFRFIGLGQGALRVSAWATRKEEKTVVSELTGREHKRKVRSTWRAEARPVEPGTEGLLLTLSPGFDVRGRVVDHRGLAVAKAKVSATRWGPFRRLEGHLMTEVRAEDGSFELPGLLPGEWELQAMPYGESDPSEPVTVRVPASAPIEIVLPIRAIVSGVVLDDRGAPAAGAVVTVEYGGLPSVTTDESGAFTLAGLPVGPVKLIPKGADNEPGEALEIELAPAEQRTGVVLRLRPSAVIVGEVLGRDGRHEVDQSVFASAGEGFHVDEETDEEGHFELRGVPVGEVTLTAETSSGIALQRKVNLRAGETLHVRLALEERALVQVSGRITAGSAPLEDVELYAHASDGSGSATVSYGEVEKSGVYRLLLPGPGSYSLSMVARNLAWKGTLTVPAVPELAHDIAIPVGRISGRVSASDGRPIAEIKVESEPERHEAGQAFGMGYTHGYTHTDEEGRYELVLPSGRHTVRAGGDQVPQRRANFAEKSIEGLVLAANAHLHDVDFVLAEGGTIRVLLRGPMTDTELWSFEAGGPRGLGAAYGTFSIVGLAPGRYLIGATQEHAATREPVAVEVEAGATRELILELVPATQIHVRARDASGAPLDCEIRATGADGRPCPQRTGAPGEAWIGALLPGRYTVRATREGRTVERVVELTGPSPLEVELAFD